MTPRVLLSSSSLIYTTVFAEGPKFRLKVSSSISASFSSAFFGTSSSGTGEGFHFKGRRPFSEGPSSSLLVTSTSNSAHSAEMSRPCEAATLPSVLLSSSIINRRAFIFVRACTLPKLSLLGIGLQTLIPPRVINRLRIATSCNFCGHSFTSSPNPSALFKSNAS